MDMSNALTVIPWLSYGKYHISLVDISTDPACGGRVRTNGLEAALALDRIIKDPVVLC
jgi:hypothetical protein